MNDNHRTAEDDPRDAHLLAALRHAPDRDAVPPPEVSARIRAAARAAVQSAHDTRTPWWQRLSAWLMQPQVAASFGTLVVASLVGVMWSTREPPVAEFVPSPPAAASAEQAPAAPPPAAAPPVDAGKADASGTFGVPAAKRELPETRDELAAAPPPKPAPRRDAAAPTELRSRRAAVEGPAATAHKTEPAAATAVAPPPAPLQAADSAAPPAAAERRAANESDLPVLARQQGGAASHGASAVTLGLSAAAKARAAEPLAGIDAALAAGARWRGAGSVGERQHGEAQRAFWASVKEATQGRWQAVQATSPYAPWLVLEPEPGAIVWILNDALYIAAQGQSWRAPVDAAQLADWKREVARW